MDVSQAFLIITGLISLIYCIQLLLYLFYWKAISKPIKKSPNTNTKVTVVVPVRNEEKNIVACIKAISNQCYQNQLFELIIVDDCSEDKTVEIALSELANQEHLNSSLVQLNRNETTGKKAAITKAVESSNGDLILTTDGDCTMGPHWIRSMVSCYEHNKPKVIIGTVLIKLEETLFEKLQSIELCGLAMISGASIQQNQPLMANGGNLCYEKKEFYNVRGFRNNKSIPSGDDIFLVLDIHKTNPTGVVFANNIDAVVFTKTQKSLLEFYHQRKRWASKSAQLPSLHIKWMGIVVFGTNLLLLSGIPLALFYNEFDVIVFISIFGFKSIIDFIFLYIATSYFKKEKLMTVFPIGQLINIIYVSLFGMVGFFGKYNWKGRIH